MALSDSAGLTDFLKILPLATFFSSLKCFLSSVALDYLKRIFSYVTHAYLLS